MSVPNYRGNTLSDFLVWAELAFNASSQESSAAFNDLMQTQPLLVALYSYWAPRNNKGSMNALKEDADRVLAQAKTSFNAANTFTQFEKSDLYTDLKEGASGTEFTNWMNGSVSTFWKKTHG